MNLGPYLFPLAWVGEQRDQQRARLVDPTRKNFGFNVPVLIDRDDKVIAGHGRLLACAELGWTEVPTLCLDHLTAAQAGAFMIADNRLTEIAAWDDRLLAQQLKELSLLGLDFDVTITGFEVAEIDLRIASLEDLPETDNDPADVVPEVPADPPLSKLGDLWVLGRHRVLCGNALDPEAFKMLLGEEHAAMVLTDTPYNLPIEGHVSGLGAVHHRPFPMASGEMDRPEFIAFLDQACRNLAAFSDDGSLHYLFMDWRHIEDLLAVGRGVYGELKNLCVWVKDNAGMGSFYRSRHELVAVFNRPQGLGSDIRDVEAADAPVAFDQGQNRGLRRNPALPVRGLAADESSSLSTTLLAPPSGPGMSIPSSVIASRTRCPRNHAVFMLPPKVR